MQEAWKRVEKAQEEGGEEAARLAFRDEMIKLGHLERIRNLYKVLDKLTQKPKWFKPNAPQEQYLETKRKKNITLKTRQLGMTTLIGIEELDLAYWEPDFHSGIMAHQQDAVKKLFDKVIKFPHDHFKKDWGHLYKPAEKKNNTTALEFEHDGFEGKEQRRLNSSVSVAYNFRSGTLNKLHVSEAAFVADERLKGSLQVVPDTGETDYESTPNGQGGDFFNQWQNWKKLKELAPYKGHFFPWFEFYPENPEDPRWRLPEDKVYDSYERDLLERFPDQITDVHLAWRRNCVAEKCQNDPDAFDNEYPTDDVSCFLTGQGQVFPKNITAAQQRYNRDFTVRGYLMIQDGKIELLKDQHGPVYIWEDPEPNKTYVIGADPSGGVGKDNAAAFVLCQQTGRTVAKIWGQIEPAEFARDLYKIARMYNKAWICPEENNHGHVVIQELINLGYGNLYRRRSLDQFSQKETEKIGFLTTNESKIVLTENYKAACKKGKIQILDTSLISEMSTFVQIAGKGSTSRVRREATEGNHDDQVIAASLAWEMHRALPIVTGKHLARS